MERLSGLDASLLYLETSRMQLNVAFAILFDPATMLGGYDFNRVVSVLAERAGAEPALRRRLVQVPFRIHHPLWVDDPGFDILHHVRHVALPEPGDLRAFGELAGRIIATPLDRARPLWEAWVIDGVEGRLSALFMKFHHSAVDGVSGTELLMRILQKTPVEVPPVFPKAYTAGERIPSDLELFVGAVGERLAHPRDMVRLLGKSARSVRNVLGLGRQEDGGTRTPPLTAPRTFFNTRIGPRRLAAFVTLSLPDVKRIKRATGTTVNDVVLAVCGGALRRYLEARDALPDKPLTAMVPVSVRTEEDRDAINNRVSGMWSTLATHLEDPIARLRAVHEDMKGAKGVLQAVGADLLQDWAEFAPQRALNLAVRSYARLRFAERVAPVHNLIVSNVPGPRYPLYLAGARVEAITAMGPVMEDMGLNISLMSYQDRIDLTILVDPDLVPDVWDLAACFQPALEALLAAAAREEAENSERRSS